MTDQHSDTAGPAPHSEGKADCYSEGERGWMEFGQRVRATLLGPGLAPLTRMGVSPDMVTLAAGVVGAAFFPLWLLHFETLALIVLWVHVLLDGLDGPLARFQKVASPRGSFTDTFTDQLIVTLVMIAWMIMSPSPLQVGLGALYIFLYAEVVAMAMVRNALYVPYSWLVRPRFFVYATLTLDYALSTQWTLIILGISNLLLAMKSFSGFIALRRQLPGPNSRA